MTYMVNGRQYVAVDAGNSLFVWALKHRTVAGRDAELRLKTKTRFEKP